MKVPSRPTERAASLRARCSALRAGARVIRAALAERTAAAGRAIVSFLEAVLLALARGAGFASRAVRAVAGVLGRWASALAAGLVCGAPALGSRVAARARGAGIGPLARRGGFALAAVCALLAVRGWLVFRALPGVRERRADAPASPRGRSAARVRSAGQAREAVRVSPPSRVSPRSRVPRRSPRPGYQRAGQGPSARLTGRGGVVVVFGTCFLGLLITDWTGWAELAGAVFFMASTLTAYYVRPGSLLPVAVSPPLLFFAAMALEKLVIASGMLAAFSSVLVALSGAAPWLFAGTALTVGIALLRGLPREVRTLILELRGL